MYRQSEKIGVLRSSIFSTCLHNITISAPIAAEIGWRVWDTTSNQISTGFASWLRYCTDVAQRRSTILCTTFGRLLGWYTIYQCIFGGSCLLLEFCQVRNSLCVQVLRSPILAAWLHGTRAVGVSQTLRRCTRNGITAFRSSSFSTEVATYIPRAAIMLGMGPHSSFTILNCNTFLEIYSHHKQHFFSWLNTLTAEHFEMKVFLYLAKWWCEFWHSLWIKVWDILTL